MRYIWIWLLLPSIALSQSGKISVLVRDFESGQIVTNAEVDAGFNTNIKPGWGWGGGKPNRVIGYTETNGICVITGKGNGASVGIAAGKEGYYGSSGYSVSFTNQVGLIRKRWEPWNPTVEVLLKRIVNPVPLYAKYVKMAPLPKENVPLGFDLVEGDWVAPYGIGKKSDLILRLDRTNERKVSKKGVHKTYDVTLYNLTLTVTGSAEGDGFIEHPLPLRVGGSSLRMPRFAPENGYTPIITKKNYRDSIYEPSVCTAEDAMNYFFRVRTELDREGQMQKALYGKMHGDFQLDHNGYIAFSYYLNPNFNDRNLEFDREQNLFKTKPSEQRISLP